MPHSCWSFVLVCVLICASIPPLVLAFLFRPSRPLRGIYEVSSLSSREIEIRRVLARATGK